MQVETQVGQYLSEIGQWNPLPAKRERELAAVIRKYKGGKQKQSARTELMQCNLKWVVTIAYEYARHTNMPIMDIIGAGNLGLIKAVDRFNPKKFKTKFSTYCVHWIKQSIRKEIARHNNHVHIPSHIQIQASQYAKLIKEKEANGETLTDLECMERLKVSPEGLRKIQATRRSVVSIDQNSIKGDDASATYADVIADNNAIMPDDLTAAKDLKTSMNEALGELDVRSRDIVISQCMQEDKIELHRLGQKYGVTGECIRLIKNNALANLKKIIQQKISIGRTSNEKRTTKGLSIQY